MAGRGRGRRATSPPRSITRRLFLRAGAGAAGTLILAGASAHHTASRLNDVGRFDPDALAGLRQGGSSHLLDRYPALGAAMPWRPIGRHDTPVEALPPLDGATDVQLFVKRDDLTSDLYGGNKVRKLEHYLAEAALAERRTLITLGATGTNHGLATALHGRELGFAVRIALFERPVTPDVKHNLRAALQAGAELHYGGGELGAMYRARALYAAADANDESPYFIMLGGSSRLGTLAHVNAGLELAAQVRAGAMPEPDRIFVAFGSCGTAAGLAAGCRLAGLRSRVNAVRVSVPVLAHAFTLHYLANDVLRWLGGVDDSMTRHRLGFRDFDVVTSELGDGYGHPTASGRAALEWIAPVVPLETTYTAKALAACLDYCRRAARPGETVLYWHTANRATVPLAGNVDGLPARLQEILAD